MNVLKYVWTFIQKYRSDTKISSSFNSDFGEQQKQIASVREGVSVFHCKLTPECHFHPHKRLLSVIPVALFHSAYTIANSICLRMWDGNIAGQKSRSTKLQWPFVARGENQITKATMQTKDDLGIEGASLLGKRYLRKEYFIGSDWNLNGSAQEVFFNPALNCIPPIQLLQSSNLLNFTCLKHYNCLWMTVKMLSDIFI